MLKILETISNDNFLSKDFTTKIAKMILDKTYDYSIDENISKKYFQKSKNIDVPHLKSFFEN